jgi:hypothetical protein
VLCRQSSFSWGWNYRGLAAVGRSVARRFVQTYNLDVQHSGCTDCNDLCVYDADDPSACGEVRKVSRIILWGSAVIWSCGFFVAYLLGPILERKDR